MDIFLQQLANGLTIGSMFALVALGYTMVYGVMKLINFAHGDMVAASAFVGLTIYTQVMGQATSLAAVIVIFLLTAAVMACVGIILERVAYRPLREAPRLSAVVSALGASLVSSPAEVQRMLDGVLPKEQIAEIMAEAGLVDVTWLGLTGGIVTLHEGTVPER